MNFKQACDIVLAFEGGLVSHPKDPGGLTNFGISKRAYPHLDIVNLTAEDAHRIYKRDYWDRIRGDDLPPGIALMGFDAAVNQGVSYASRMLQKATHTATVDGIIGNESVRLLNDLPSNTEALVMMAQDRALRYADHKAFDTFKRGWYNRLFTVLMYGIEALEA